MTNHLRSAGEEGTSISYGDFTNFGHYRNDFADFQAVLNHETESSGAESQVDVGVPMEPVVYTANKGYYFPDTYAVASVSS